MTSVLVIGAAGYSGAHVAAAFAGAGYRVAAMQRPGGRPVPDAYQPVPGDLADPPSLTAAARGFDLVVQIGRIEGDIERLGAQALMDSGARLIHTSGCDVLGAGFRTEDSEPQPPPIVGWRAAVERCVLAGGGIIVRPGLIYGHGGGVVPDMLVPLAARIGAGVYIGEKGVRWAAVHVDDLARLYLAVAQRAAPGTAWNGTSETVTVDELAGAVGGGTAVSWPEQLPAPAEIADIAPLFRFDQDVSSEKTRREMGWEPAYPSIVQYLQRGPA
jgi:nucleoside-diphosphate-sugar epimerase